MSLLTLEMNNFPTSAEEFYALRDDRTSRCRASREYQDVGCTLYLSPDVASTATGQTMLAVAANLLSRWCRKVALVLPSVNVHPRSAWAKTILPRRLSRKCRTPILLEITDWCLMVPQSKGLFCPSVVNIRWGARIPSS